ncbi:hypothetical protein D3C78_1983990 [compost metagenome]
MNDLGKNEGIEWSDFRRLQDNRAPTGKRRRDLLRDLVQRIVPGRDGGDHPHGFAHNH